MSRLYTCCSSWPRTPRSSRSSRSLQDARRCSTRPRSWGCGPWRTRWGRRSARRRGRAWAGSPRATAPSRCGTSTGCSTSVTGPRLHGPDGEVRGVPVPVEAYRAGQDSANSHRYAPPPTNDPIANSTTHITTNRPMVLSPLKYFLPTASPVAYRLIGAVSVETVRGAVRVPARATFPRSAHGARVPARRCGHLARDLSQASATRRATRPSATSVISSRGTTLTRSRPCAAPSARSWASSTSHSRHCTTGTPRSRADAGCCRG